MPEGPSEPVVSVLHQIPTIRIGFACPTVVTTNLTLEEIGRHYRESIPSRLGGLPTLVMQGSRLEGGVTHAWVAFAELVADRLEKGRATYGDRSFSRAPVELAKEIEEEILDVCAWSFILWTRLREIRRRLSTEPSPVGFAAEPPLGDRAL